MALFFENSMRNRILASCNILSRIGANVEYRVWLRGVEYKVILIIIKVFHILYFIIHNTLMYLDIDSSNHSESFSR